ncbi:hypothetical protein [Paenibacillus sp. Soil724D2]|uniref:hypothetical protein n=1 Tax=Paenibacillus sp. (strain Soil724D2) TaxID=1736392 RepID=UPI000AAE8D46|nr:hypothetical protein [Paenibacillus sp. Soil724D2]
MKFEMALGMYSCAEAIAAFYNALIENGVPEDVALELTLAVLENALNGAVQR